VTCGRFHSAVATKSEVYTFGLNAGQLGHTKGDSHIVTVSAIKTYSHIATGSKTEIGSQVVIVIVDKTGLHIEE